MQLNNVTLNDHKRISLYSTQKLKLTADLGLFMYF